VFLDETMQKRNRRIGATAAEQRYVKEQFRAEFYCIIQSRLLPADLDSGLVDRDPRRLRQRRGGNAVSHGMYPLKDRLMRAFDTE